MKPTQMHLLFLFLGLTACQPSFSVTDSKTGKSQPLKFEAQTPSGYQPSTSAPEVADPTGTATQMKTAEISLESCFSPGEACDKKIIQFIRTAQKSLDIAVFSFTHAGIARAIEDAHARGVRVRMVVDREQSQNDGSLVDEMQAAGVPLKFGSQKGLMHNKFTILDKQALETGSYNYSYAATSYNAENQLYLKDTNIIDRFQKDFEKLWGTGLEN
jgi:phosphatidylserine/phosphatidylglycerophosphate/cardiolipin synthase-like enzyme